MDPFQVRYRYQRRALPDALCFEVDKAFYRDGSTYSLACFIVYWPAYPKENSQFR